MDVDITEDNAQSSSSQPSSRRHIIAPVDDAHPFDLEGYISNYTGLRSALEITHISAHINATPDIQDVPSLIASCR